MTFLKGALEWLWTAFVAVTIFAGFWLASSLSIYLHAPFWVACAAGLLAFPALPLAWEALDTWRAYRRRAPDAEGTPDRYFTLRRRFVARTLVVNIAFIAFLGYWFPQSSVEAVSTRGDWMLEGRRGAWTKPMRGVLFTGARGVAWLYDLGHTHRYEDIPDVDRPAPEPNRPPERPATKETQGPESSSTRPKDVGTTPSSPSPEGPSAGDGTPASDRPRAGGADGTENERRIRHFDRPDWPLANEPHAAARSAPEPADTDPDGIASHIERRVENPYLRAKAAYDWIALHIAYDVETFRAGENVPNDPSTILRRELADCAGYSRLFKAIVGEFGLEAVLVSGTTRNGDVEIADVGHVWNAVEIEGEWHLLDANWGAGYNEEEGFVRRYDSSYFMTPPEIFLLNHFPDDPRWQLLDDPLSHSEFLRRPKLKPWFYRHGFDLIRPKRSQVSALDSVRIEIANPRNRFVWARVRPRGAPDSELEGCGKASGQPIELSCSLDEIGTHVVVLASADERNGYYRNMGRFQVQHR